jgi:sRNA-binding carbon storage regulator CsrA
MNKDNSGGFLALTVTEGSSVYIELNGTVVEVKLGKKVSSQQRRLLFKAPKEVNIKRELEWLEKSNTHGGKSELQ